ncbi:MAG: phosphatase PAP2 family protein [Acidobacteriota bacterium]
MVVLATVLLAGNCIVWDRMPEARWLIAADVALIALVMMLGPGVIPASSPRSWFRDFYIAPVLYLFYRQACLTARALHNGRTYDTILLEADRWLFCVDPTRWLARYAHPLVTEVLQLAYACFYFLFLLVAWDLLRSGKRLQFDAFSFGVAYGFGLSYLAHWLLPSVGPRFVLHSFSGLDAELPGLFLTPCLRAFVNWGGSIVPGTDDRVAMTQAFPDVFLSGHAMMTLALMFWSFRFSSRLRWPVLVTGSLLIASTVYLRYHYVIDVLAGGGLALFCLASEVRLYQAIQRLLAGASRHLERNA